MNRRRGAVAVLLAAVAAGGGAAAVVPATAATPAPARLLVTATEYRLALSRATLKDGPAIIELQNSGQDGHDLVVRRLTSTGREFGPRRAFPETQPDALSTRSVTLAPGPYVLYCTLPGHRKLGMIARLRVR